MLNYLNYADIKDIGCCVVDKLDEMRKNALGNYSFTNKKKNNSSNTFFFKFSLNCLLLEALPLCKFYIHTVCPGNGDPFYIVSYYIVVVILQVADNSGTICFRLERER